MLNTMKGIARDTNKSLRKETEGKKKKSQNIIWAKEVI